MTHTPSFSKKIREAELLTQRIKDDQTSFGESKIHFQSEGLFGSIDETQTKRLMYADFYQRTQSSFSPLQLYIAPRLRYRTKIFDSEDVLKQYSEDFHASSKELDRLGILHESQALYDDRLYSSLDDVSSTLVRDHRVGLRSDIVYYDIKIGKIVPGYRLESEEVNKESYIVNFFLHARKDTVPLLIKNPYEIFASAAVLVHPKDKRYRKMHNRELIVPIANTTIPVIPYEGVSVEGLGTRILIPAHNIEDYKLALELGITTDLYAFDKFGNFATTENVAEEFRSKNILNFGDNIVKYLFDISNLKEKITTSHRVFRDRKTQHVVYPILEKNMYFSVGGLHTQDKSFLSPESEFVGHQSDFLKSLEQQENYAISNKDRRLPSLGSFGGYFESDHTTSYQPNFFEYLVRKFVLMGLLKTPAKGEDILDIFSCKFQGQYLRTSFLENSHESPIKKDDIVLSLIRSLNAGDIKETTIEKLLEYIDLGSYFVYTKKGYILAEKHHYHYDPDFISLVYVFSRLQNKDINFVTTNSDSVFLKYLLYLSFFLLKQPLQVSAYILDETTVFGENREESKSLHADLLRLVLLQDAHHDEHEVIDSPYSPEELDQFISKWRNLSRVIPLSDIKTLPAIIQDLQKNTHEMNDYDRYLISSIHKLYDDVQFRLSKHQTDKIVFALVSVLRKDIADILVYVLKMRSSAVSEKVGYYVIVFATHLLYPLAPTTMFALMQHLGITRYKEFFEKPLVFDVDQNIKCNFVMQFITQWYQETKKDNSITGFILRANEDFIEYAKKIIPDFYGFLGSHYTVKYLNERDDRPEEIEAQKVFAMEWGIEKRETTTPEEAIELDESLAMLQKQLRYKQQLSQTLKNTLMRVRSSGALESSAKYEEQLTSLKEEISILEYKISKLKYF